MVKIKDLIAFLQTHDPELPVAIEMYSDQILLELKDIRITELSLPRGDGWVESRRPDKELMTYLLFPGN